MDSWTVLAAVAVLWALLGPVTTILVLALRRRIPYGIDREDRRRALTRVLIRRWFLGAVSVIGGGVVALVVADNESEVTVGSAFIVIGTLFGLWTKRLGRRYETRKECGGG